MIHINVVQEIKKINHTSPSLYAFIIYILFFGITGYGISYFFTFSLHKEIQVLEVENVEKKDQVEKLKLKKMKIEKLKSDLNNINNIYAKIDFLEKKRKNTIFILDKIQRFHIEKMWLDNFSVKNQHVSLKGYALDNFIVAEYISKLRAQSPQYQDLLSDNIPLKEDEEEAIDVMEPLVPEIKDDPSQESALRISTIPKKINFMNVNLIKTAIKEIDKYNYQNFEINFDVDSE